MQRVISKIAIFSLAFAAIVGITVLITGQPVSKLSRQPAAPHRVGVVDDWSFHHLVFSNPGTYERAAKTRASYAKWLSIRYDTRFILQQMKRHEEAVSPSGMLEHGNLAIGVLRPLHAGPTAKPKPGPKPKPKPLPKPPQGLWSESLSTGTVQPNAFPAKWGPSLTMADCFHDYVVYPTGTAGTSSAASIFAFYTLYSNCPLFPHQVIPSIYWAFNTGGTVSTSPIISGDGSQVAFIQSNGATASLVLLKPFLTIQGNITDNSETLTVTSGTVTSADVGMLILGQFIGPGTTVTGVSEDGSTITMSQGAANTQTGITFTLAEPGTLSSPWTLTSQASGADYQACAAPCMLTLPLSGTVNDTLSAPFYDFASDDALYVGDDGGYLHKFTGIFFGTPAEVTTSPWPVRLSTTNKLTSPVYDPVSGNVFVGDMAGYLHSVGATGSVATSAQLGDVIADAPLVDSSAGTVYAFVTTSGGSNTVYQFSTTNISGTGNGSVTVGTGGTGYYLYAGDFDNVYYESSAHTGHLYVVGNTGVTTGATLYQISITSNSMGGATGVVTGLTGATSPWPSPLVEFCNNGKSPCSTDGTSTTAGTDYLFFSVNSGDLTGSKCTNGAGNGCVLSLNISNPSRSPTTVTGTVSTTNSPGSPGVTLTGSDTFTAADVGAFISGAGIPPGDTIATLVGTPPTTTANLATAPTTDESAEPLTITGVTLSGSLNVTNVGSNGCWATGGFVIDNSDTYAPANQNQVYFIGLSPNVSAGDGNTAGGPGGVTSTACTSASGNTILGWQASQSALQ